ncbi:hypothetical protein [Paraperlucidibaca sp.]|uniref:hypothetical protein n=1 Tax=Paraperlucidibaca sp. TaxID=2708021 RepID=UPI0030F40007
MNILTRPPTPAYAHRAVTLLAAELGSLNQLSRRISATNTVGAFFVPAVSSYGGCARDTFGCADFLDYRSANSRTVTTSTCLAASRGDSNNLGVSLMQNTTQGASAPTSLLRKITAHRRMAFAALRADSSTSVRLARYNQHMSKARALAVVEVSHV